MSTKWDRQYTYALIGGTLVGLTYLNGGVFIFIAPEISVPGAIDAPLFTYTASQYAKF